MKIFFLTLFITFHALNALTPKNIDKSIVSNRLKRNVQPEGLLGVIRDFFRSLHGEINGKREVKKKHFFQIFFGDYLTTEHPSESGEEEENEEEEHEEPDEPDTPPPY